MQEKLLHFIWKHQYFDHSRLLSDSGDDVLILSPGSLNQDHGPDFLDAEILIGGMYWRGHVEMHIDTRQWKQHGHHLDRKYDNVILHVSWEPGDAISRSDGTTIPNLALCDRTPTHVIERYHRLHQGLPLIPCSTQIEDASPGSIRLALERELDAYLASRAERVRNIWRQNQFDWEQTSFIWFARHFGFSVNNDAFEVLASSIPYRILLRVRDNSLQLEAFLFGMAGFLNRRIGIDPHYNELMREFEFLRHKYRVKPRLEGHEWKFLRMRPSNFPTVRLAQLTAALAEIESLSELIHTDTPFPGKIEPSSYWLEHYDFGKKRKHSGGTMGAHSSRLLFMNTVIPLRRAYAMARGDSRHSSAIGNTLQQLPPEDNRIIRLWKKLHVNMETALDSQGYLALYRRKCSKRACLDCPVGMDLLRHTP